MADQCILVTIDFSDVTRQVLDEARQLAKAFNARIYLVHVDIAVNTPDFIGYDVGPEYMRAEIAQQIRHEHRDLEALEKQLHEEGFKVTSLLIAGEPSEKILDQAERLKPLFIVLGSHGHGHLYRLLAGSVVDGVLKQVSCPVVIVPAKARSAARELADESKTAQKAAEASSSDTEE